MITSVVCERGSRPYMEDNYSLVNKEGLVIGGVYDGHLGSGASRYAAKEITSRVLRYLEQGLTVEESFRLVYREVQWQINDSRIDGGTMAADFLIENGVIYTAESGDCKIIVVGHKSHRVLTRLIYHGDSLGDRLDFFRYTFAEHLIEDDDIMLIAGSDGLFDFMCDADIATIVQDEVEPFKVTEKLNAHLSGLASKAIDTDNYTIIAVSLKD